MPRSKRSRGRRREAAYNHSVPFSDQFPTAPLGVLLDDSFTLISFQYAVVHRGQYYPCEVGAIQFSLTGGIKNAYHTFVSPKPLPPGVFADFKTHSEETHQLPFSGDFFYWNNDFSAISYKLLSMIGDKYEIFSKNAVDELGIIKGCLKYLDAKCQNGISHIAVSPIDRLVECIARRFDVFIESPDEIEKYLARPNHDFDRNIRCFHHESLDGHHCAYAAVYRVYFNLMDFMYERGIIRVPPSYLEVPQCFVSRYFNQDWPVQDASQVNCGNQIFQSSPFDPDLVSEHSSMLMGGDDSDTSTIMDNAGLTTDPNMSPTEAGVTWFTADQMRNEWPILMNSQQLDVGGNTRGPDIDEIIQDMSPTAAGVTWFTADQMRSEWSVLVSSAGGPPNVGETMNEPEIEVIKVGPAPIRYIPARIFGITTEPSGPIQFYFSENQ